MFHAFLLSVPLTAFVSISVVHHCSAHTCMYTYGTIPTLNACTTCPVVGVVLQYQLATLAYTGGKLCALKQLEHLIGRLASCPLLQVGIRDLPYIVMHEPLQHCGMAGALQTRHVEHV